ncbi:MAG: S8 family serine peptidase [Candidatus Sericytochromatia bacterium]|nr:S8 family serine peptidase [Candidatus Sericytochromatia bacterium]
MPRPVHPPKTRASQLHRGVAGVVLALALAGCQSGPRAFGSFALGEESRFAAPVGLPAIALDRTKRDGYFVMALPDEAPLPRLTTQVAGGGTAGSLNTRLADNANVVVTSVMPNAGRGFVLEGINLNRASLRFFLGSSELAVTRRLSHTVTLSVTGATTSGTFSVQDAGRTIYSVPAMDARGSTVFGRVLVRFREGSSRAAVEAALLAAGITYYRYPGLNYVVACHRPDVTFDSVSTQLKAHTVFDQVTRETVFGVKGTPVDPRYAEQWALKQVNAEAAWSFTDGSPDVIVAILDTGINTTHPDLASNLAVNARETPGNRIDDDNNGRIDDVNGWNCLEQTGIVEDDNGHGTQAAGIVGAVENDVGIVGLAPKTRLLPCKVATSEGLSTSSSIVDGINYAVRNRASVILLAQASSVADPAVRDAMEFATTFNVTCVAPMGNDGNSVPNYPAAWANELNFFAVGASNRTDARPSWGNTGGWMTVCAPGEGILTTTRGGSYATVSGTSFAAAHVAGQAALIKALKPSWTPAMVREMVSKSAIDRGSLGYDTTFGHGRITMDSAAFGNLLGQILDGMGIKTSSEHFSGLAVADMANDRNSETIWSSARTGGFEPQWLRVDLGKPTRLTSIAALTPSFYGYLFPASFQVQLSDDDVSWRTVATETDLSLPDSTWRRWNIAATTARYVRFNVTKSRQNIDNQLYYAQIAEVAFNGEENNIVLNSSTSYYGTSYPTAHMVDKDPNTMWVSAPRGGMTREFAIVDLKVSHAFRTIKLLSAPPIIANSFPRAIDFYTSNDKVNWVYLKSFKNLTSLPATWYTFSVPDVSARYIRIDIPETNRVRGAGSLYGGYGIDGFLASVAEVEVQ